MKQPRTALILVLLALPAAGQDVPYTRYELDNGLSVILHEDHNLPQVAVNIWYRVGGKDEARGRSGFAHLFEHLMFMGTERVPGGQFDAIMEAGGGYNNASTSFDRTNYFDIGPSELLPTLLWLEADRLEDLARAMTADKLDRQREVVRNERRQSYENRPYGRAYLVSHALLYPPGHPYHDPVIGTHADLEAATVKDVTDFFGDYYVPNNASLVVAGDFDPALVKPTIERLFGSLPRGADPVRAAVAPLEPGQPGSAIVHTMTDAVQFAQTNLHWHSPPFFAPGDAEMDLAGGILADGVSSRLYQALVAQGGLALEVGAHQASRVLGSSFTISALARPGVELEVLEAAIDAELALFLEGGPTAAEVERQQAQLEAQSLRGLQSVRAKADRLNLYAFHLDEPNSFAADLDRYRDATPAGVHEWAARVLGGARVVVRVLPETPAPPENPRDERPGIDPAAVFDPAPPVELTLSNGVPVLFWRRPELPLVEIAVLLRVGSARDPGGKYGLAHLTASMLDEGAGGKTAAGFAAALEHLGASISIGVGQESTEVRLAALARNFDASLALFADALLRPDFDDGEWRRVHELHLAALVREQDDPQAVARKVSLRAFFGDEHPYGRPPSGTPTGVEAIKRGDVVNFYADHFGPRRAVLLVAGDLTREDAEAALEGAFGTWRGLLDAAPDAQPPALAVPDVVPPVAPPSAEGLRVFVVDRPAAVQTVVRFLLPAPAFADPTRPARELVVTILGGTFTSRLNQNLREDKGYTYGASSRFVLGPSAGYLFAQSSVRADVTGASLTEFLAELEGLRGGDITEEEAGKARATRRLRVVQGFEGLGGLLDVALLLVQNDLPFEALAAELEAISALGAQDLNALAASTVPLERGVLVLVGDRGLILEQLAALDLGLPQPVLLGPDGAPVSSAAIPDDGAPDDGRER